MEGDIITHTWIVTASALATALFTGIMAYLAWKQARGGVGVEFNYDYLRPEGIACTLTVRNNLAMSISPKTVTVKGIGITGVSVNQDSRSPLWQDAKIIPLSPVPIPPNKGCEYRFTVMVNWEEMLAAQSGALPWLRSLFLYASRVKKATMLRNSSSAYLMINVGDNFRFKTIKKRIIIPLSVIERRANTSAQSE